MMDGMEHGDEFAEIDTSEAEIDWMMATGEPVAVVMSPVPAGGWLRAAWTVLPSPPRAYGGVTSSVSFPIRGVGVYVGCGLIQQTIGV